MENQNEMAQMGTKVEHRSKFQCVVRGCDGCSVCEKTFPCTDWIYQQEILYTTWLQCKTFVEFFRTVDLRLKQQNLDMSREDLESYWELAATEESYDKNN